MMELFGRKEVRKIQEKSDEVILKEGLEEEIEDLQRDFRILQEEVNENEKKLQAVKEEYDSTVTSLMDIKKETNQFCLNV